MVGPGMVPSGGDILFLLVIIAAIGFGLGAWIF